MILAESMLCLYKMSDKKYRRQGPLICLNVFLLNEIHNTLRVSSTWTANDKYLSEYYVVAWRME